MSAYEVTAADRRPIPRSYAVTPRRLGYAADEHARPFAHHFRTRMEPVPDHVAAALRAGRRGPEHGYEVQDAARRLRATGGDPMETGWARTDRGTLHVACRTDMPGVTAPMWDWWFGWHSTDPARYKLWHPGAHLYAAVGEDRSADRGLTDRQRYVDNVSYVDEYVGGTVERLAIRFVDPARLGFADTPDSTVVCARVGPSDVPVAAGWLVHQVRPTPDGCEMRSRFFLGHPEVLPLPPHSVSRPFAARLLRRRIGRRALAARVRRTTRDAVGRDLLQHCSAEMNHLAAVLPALYAEFRDVP